MDQDRNGSFLENEIKQQMLMTLEIHNNIWQFPPERVVKMLSPKTLRPRAENSAPCGECEGKVEGKDVETGGEEVGEKTKGKEKEKEERKKKTGEEEDVNSLKLRMKFSWDHFYSRFVSSPESDLRSPMQK